jgi:uncharacterized protein YjbJ (UPF0337 family)
MSDVSDHQSGFGGTPSQTPNKSGSVTEQASALASNLKEQTSTAVGAATRQIKDQVSGAADAAKGLASEAKDKVRDALEEQKTAGADYVGSMAGAIRRAANEFDREIPQAAQYIRRAADQVDNVSEALRRRDFSELIDGVQDFARRQPTAFFGATVLAGFAAVRFLKSSAGTRSTASGDDEMSDAWSRPGDGRYGARSGGGMGPDATGGYGGMRSGTAGGAGLSPSGGTGSGFSGMPSQYGSQELTGAPAQPPGPGSTSPGYGSNQ